MEGTLYNPNHFAAQLPDDTPIVFYIGAMASGHLTKDENPEVSTAIPTAIMRVIALLCWRFSTSWRIYPQPRG